MSLSCGSNRRASQLVFRRWRDGVAQHLESFDTALEAVAGLHRTYARGRAGEYEITGAELIELRQCRNDVRHIPDHTADVRLLTQGAVHAQPDTSASHVSGAHWTDGRDRRRVVEALGGVPRLAAILGRLLQIAARQVVAGGVAKHQLQRLLRRHVTSPACECDHQLDLVVEVGCARRIGNLFFVGDHRIRGLHEEYRWRVFGVASELADVVGVVEADAVDSMDRKATLCTGHGNARHGGRQEGEVGHPGGSMYPLRGRLPLYKPLD